MYAAFFHHERGGRESRCGLSWKSENGIELDQIPTSQWLAQLKVSDLCRKLIQIELEGTNNVAITRQSYLAIWRR